ncbi:hypothetical protein LINPERHAP1_LOCUS35718 [Linum perenne]
MGLKIGLSRNVAGLTIHKSSPALQSTHCYPGDNRSIFSHLSSVEDMNFTTVQNRSLHHPLISNIHKLPRLHYIPQILRFSLITSPTDSLLLKLSSISRINASVVDGKEEGLQQEGRGDDGFPQEIDYLARDGAVYRDTLRLVECSMFAAVTGLVYFLSNSLSIENYFGCFFPLPIVISSLRWGVAAGRKTMVATAMLLFVLSGPVKALTYLLTHGIVGLTMGYLWSIFQVTSKLDSFHFLVHDSRVSLPSSSFIPFPIFWAMSCLSAQKSLNRHFCYDLQARATGSMGYVLTSSFLIRENILALITVNIHASLSYVFASIGINTIPSMNFIYTLFGTLVVINSGFFVFLLHLLHSMFLTRLGMRHMLRLPAWVDRAFTLV